MNTIPKITIHNRHLFESATVDERCTVVASPLSDYPAKSNPFNYDLSSMGANINKEFTMMFNSSHNQRHGSMYLYNRQTGQRVALVLLSENPRPKKLLRVSRDIASGSYYTIDCTTGERDKNDDIINTYKFLYINQQPTPGSPYRSELPVYFVFEGVGILCQVDVTKKLDELLNDMNGDFFDEERIVNAHSALCRSFEINEFDITCGN